MNAMTPIPTSGLTALIVDNERLIRALAGEARFASKAELAAATGRDPSNMNRALKALAEDGLYDAEGEGVAPGVGGLTDAGLKALAILDRAVGQGGADTTLTHAELEPDPDNRPIDEGDMTVAEELDDLAATILTGGLEYPLLITPPEQAGGKPRIFDGERRWRAIGRAIFNGDLPEDWPIPVRIRAPLSRKERLVRALIANTQRADWHPLDKARTYRELLAEGLSKDEIADAVAKDVRHVEQMLQLLDRLSDDDKARMRLPKDDPDHLGVKAALQLTQQRKEKPPLAMLSPRQAMVLAEVFHAAASRPAREPRMAGQGYTDAHGLGNPDIKELERLGLVETWFIGLPEDRAIQPGWIRPKRGAGQHPELAAWLEHHRIRFDGSGGAPEAAEALRGPVVGPLEAAAFSREGRYATFSLNPPDPARGPGRIYPNATAAGEARRIAEGPHPSPAPASPRTTAQAAAEGGGSGTENADRRMFQDDFARQMAEAAGEDDDARARSSSSPGAGRGSDSAGQDFQPLLPEPEPDALPELSPAERLALVELAHKMETEGFVIDGREGVWIPVGEFFRDATAVALGPTGLRLVGYLNLADQGRLAQIAGKGHAWLHANGFAPVAPEDPAPDNNGQEVTDDRLVAEYERQGRKPSPTSYLTAFLNRPAAKETADQAPAPPPVEPPAPDAFAHVRRYETVCQAIRAVADDLNLSLTPSQVGRLAEAALDADQPGWRL